MPFFLFFQTLDNWATLLVKTPKTFEFQAPAFGMFEHGIKVVKKDVLYNWTDNTTMKVSSSRKPFYAGKEMHLLTLEALTGTCSMPKSFVVNFVTSTGMYVYLHYIVALYFHFKISNNKMLVCHNLS
jgi:hypothetical protein